MNPRQRIRLEALAARVAPCVGCLREDFIAADRQASAAAEPSPVELHARVREHLNAQRVQDGLEPLPPLPERDSQRDLVRARDWRDEARNALLLAQRSVPASRRQASCVACRDRRRTREDIDRLSAQLAEVARRRAQEEDELP